MRVEVSEKTAAEWQKFLNAEFPDGLVVTGNYGTEGIGTGYAALVANMSVVDLSDGVLEVSVVDFELERQVSFFAKAFEQREFGWFVDTASKPNVTLSRKLSPQQREVLEGN